MAHIRHVPKSTASRSRSSYVTPSVVAPAVGLMASQGALTADRNARTLDSVEVRRGAYRHGVTEEDIGHAFRNAIKFIPYEYHGEERLLIIGPARNGAPLEMVAVPAEDPDRIIHADELRPSLYHYLR